MNVFIVLIGSFVSLFLIGVVIGAYVNFYQLNNLEDDDDLGP